jgi:hypothetical protein
MGRIVVSVPIENPSARIRSDALVDTGVSFMVLPSARRDRLESMNDVGIGQRDHAYRPGSLRLISARRVTRGERKLCEEG